MSNLPRHIVHIRDSRTPEHIFVPTELFIDGRKMLLAADEPFTIEARENGAVVLTLRVLAEVIRFTGPEDAVEYNLLDKQDAP